MNRRYYNVFFNTHTISGIVISFALFIIFYAGAFALFKDDIAVWQYGERSDHKVKKLDPLLAEFSQKKSLIGRDLMFFGLDHDSNKLILSTSELKNKKNKDDIGDYLIVHKHTLEEKSYEQHYDIGEFLYRLHFFSQIPSFGIYIAGVVGFFFLFAIVTGVIMHWSKIVPKFYHFDPKSTLKRIWADAHTSLGVIGLPFQFIFALTGTFLCLKLLVLAPVVTLYGGDQEKVIAEIYPAFGKKYPWEAVSDKKPASIDAFIQKLDHKFGDKYHYSYASIKNYGGTNMRYVLSGHFENSERFVGEGHLEINPFDGSMILIKDPNVFNYFQDAMHIVENLHYGNFAGYTNKIFYFIMAMITCFVIISGVLIYVGARQGKTRTDKQKRFTNNLGHIYMAICMAMPPVTALMFVLTKVVHPFVDDNKLFINVAYLLAWLGFALYLRYQRENLKITKISLLTTAIFGVMVPLSSGFVSGNWYWVSFQTNQMAILLVDLLWTCLGLVSFFAYFKAKRKGDMKVK